MYTTFKEVTNALYWILDAGWTFWSGLFAPLPFGDPYIAALAALLVLAAIYKAVKSARPDYH